ALCLLREGRQVLLVDWQGIGAGETLRTSAHLASGQGWPAGQQGGRIIRCGPRCWDGEAVQTAYRAIATAAGPLSSISHNASYVNTGGRSDNATQRVTRCSGPRAPAPADFFSSRGCRPGLVNAAIAATTTS